MKWRGGNGNGSAVEHEAAVLALDATLGTQACEDFVERPGRGPPGCSRRARRWAAAGRRARDRPRTRYTARSLLIQREERHAVPVIHGRFYAEPEGWTMPSP